MNLNYFKICEFFNSIVLLSIFSANFILSDSVIIFIEQYQNKNYLIYFQIQISELNKIIRIDFKIKNKINMLNFLKILYIQTEFYYNVNK